MAKIIYKYACAFYFWQMMALTAHALSGGLLLFTVLSLLRVSTENPKTLFPEGIPNSVFIYSPLIFLSLVFSFITAFQSSVLNGVMAEAWENDQAASPDGNHEISDKG